METIDIEVIQKTLHLIGVAIWVGGQIALMTLMGPLRRAAPEAVAQESRVFNRVVWPAFALVIVTGFWILGGSDEDSDQFRTTLMVKLLLVACSGVGTALYTFTKKPAVRSIAGPLGVLFALGAVLLGVSL